MSFQLYTSFRKRQRFVYYMYFLQCVIINKTEFLKEINSFVLVQKYSHNNINLNYIYVQYVMNT
jgi:hypothetical protein